MLQPACTCLQLPSTLLHPISKQFSVGLHRRSIDRAFSGSILRNYTVHAAHGQLFAESTPQQEDQSVTSEQAKQYAAQYEQLKKEMLGRTQRFAGLLSAYLFLTVSSEAALCTLLGSAASYAYLILMQRQVDAVSSTDEVPIWNAEDNVQGIARPFAIGLAAYGAAFRPRQLILISLAAGMWGCTASGLHDVTRLEQGCLLLGFLSFKAPLLLCVWDSVKPKFDPEAAKRPARPVQYNLDDEEDNLDDIMANIASVRKIRIGR